MGSVSFHQKKDAKNPGDTPQEVVSVVDFCEPNLNLLAHAQAIELEVGSRCGGHGKCGGDRVRTLGDAALSLSPITEEERRLLTPTELQQGLRLGCQCFPENPDAEIHVEIFP